ncbi:ATP-binding cassette domain-containing protein [Albidovulum sp.]|uniref:ATP-binding cassette domain-containing protein n=1 Tax=Albidovulum sp. TaxID=1872424 RepID=UPI0039B97945
MSDPGFPIRCRNLWKIYGPAAALRGTPPERLTDEALATKGLLVALRNVTLDIARGEVFVIMGLSGSGKSTLVRCMTGLVEPTLGELTINGENLRDIAPDRLIEMRRHKISMVFQDFALLPHLTVLGNIAFPLRVQGVGRARREARAAELVDLVGLAGRAHHFPHELSGGQQQRVGIARSLITDPEIWFLDEPFSALDPLIRQEMQGELLHLQATLHKTVVFITHDFDEAIRIADRIAIMRGGAVVQVDTPEGLVLHPKDDYVAAFTRRIPRDRVLSVASVLSPVSDRASGAPVPASALVGDVAARVLAAEAPVPVAGSDGRIVGSLDRAAVIGTVFGASA